MKTVKIVHLYAEELNVYGDDGNVLILQKRLQWRNIPVEVIEVGAGQDLPGDINLIVAGGGQDSSQTQVQLDLQKKKTQLLKLAQQNVPMLLVCGSYQLFGQYFLTNDQRKIDGIGLLDIYTVAGSQRMVGNITVETEQFNRLYGFENHSGETFITDPTTKPIGKVLSGFGNNYQQALEGARKYNIIGTYLHGPALSKNPSLADWLLQKALQSAGYQDSEVQDIVRSKNSFAAISELEALARKNRQ